MWSTLAVLDATLFCSNHEFKKYTKNDFKNDLKIFLIFLQCYAKNSSNFSLQAHTMDVERDETFVPRKRRKVMDDHGEPRSVAVCHPPCWPFDRDRPYPDKQELARLRALDQDGDAWAEERLKRMGASSCSAAVGLGPATPRDYWRLKTHRIERECTETSEAIMARGHRLEPLAADAYEVMMESGPLVQVGIIMHPTIAWMHCSPDRLIAKEPRGAVEIKCPVYCIPKQVPDKYMCQVQQQMACLDVDWCDLFYYLHDDESDAVQQVKCWRIWRSEAYWGVMLKRLRTMADCLQEDREPTLEDIPLRPKMPAVRTQVILEWDFTTV